MAADLRRQALRRAVTELISFETELAVRLESEQQAFRGYSDASAAIECFLPMVQMQRDRLRAYLDQLGAERGGGTPSASFVFNSTATVSGALSQIAGAFHHGAISYAMLYEMALRLYDPPLREIAPRHLKAYADATLAIHRLLPAAVASELAQDGLHCSCICPLCGLGACACVALGTRTLVAAWREAAAAESSLPGLVLQVPKPESELARAGVCGGERLLAVDGQEVRTIPEMQAAIRKHTLGDKLRFLVQRAADPPRELVVRHVSDYPKT